MLVGQGRLLELLELKLQARSYTFKRVHDMVRCCGVLQHRRA